MATAHDVFDAITPTAGNPANSFELGLAVQPGAGGGFVLLPDIVELNPTSTPKNRSRQTYAFKGSDNATKYSESLAVTVNVEIVRDAATGNWQPALIDLYNASTQKGLANKRNIQVYDLLGGPYAVQTQAAVGFAFSGNGWDDSKWATITLTGNGLPTWLPTNPVIVGIVAALSSALPTAATSTSTLTLQGSGFTGATAVTIGGTAGTNLKILSDSLMSFTVPSGSAGSAPIVVTNTNGASLPLPYTRGA